MTEFEIVRSMLLRIHKRAPASARLSDVLRDWTAAHWSWLIGATALGEKPPEGEALLRAIAGASPVAGSQPHVLDLADALGELLALDEGESALLSIIVACDRLPRVAALANIATEGGFDLPSLLGEVAGAEAHDAARFVRRSDALRLGLVGFRANRGGASEVFVGWALERLLDRAPAVGDGLVEALVGARQHARLAVEDFAQREDIEFIIRLLAGALAQRAAGVNILLHGPPGTGKTELARTLAAAAGADLYATGEAGEESDEPSRWDRVGALQLALKLLEKRGGSVLLFDEMEDLIGDARPSGGDWFAKREGSKVFVNRLLEANRVPIIWTTNAIGNVDKAILRRMSFVLRLDMPSREVGRRMLGRMAADEGIFTGGDLEALLDCAPETATVLRVASRASRLAGGADGGARPAQALVRALRGGELPPSACDPVDPRLFDSEPPIEELIERLSSSDANDVSLLLTGPPGTGKTALAHHVARALDRPLLVKRASDLLSRWVGETEAAIADAFAEARCRGGVLLFDEADSLLFDRATARTSWEVGQVNELLTWLDRHPLPVVAATNHGWRLDPAVQRRFLFKLELHPLGRARAVWAFEHFFGREAPPSLDDLCDLTPGDFALVARLLRHRPAGDRDEIVALLRREAEARPGVAAPMGF